MLHKRFRSSFLLPVALLVLCQLFLSAGEARADGDTLPLTDYRCESWFLPQSPSVTGGAAAAFFNPAAWGLTEHVGSDFWWNDRSIRSGLDNYGLSLGRNLGFAMNTTTFGVRDDSYKIYDYQIGLAEGGRSGTFGLAYRWAQGETGRTPREKALSLGFISRNNRFLSFGAAGVLSLESKAAQYVLDLGLRPLGRHWLTLFADWTVNNDQAFFADGSWGAGLEIRPVSGLHLGFRAREQLDGSDIDYSLVAGLTLNDFNFTAMPRYDQDGNLGATTFLVRNRPPYSGLPVQTPLIPRKTALYYPLDLENRLLTYQKFVYFDDQHVAWLDLMRLLDSLRGDERIAGIVINLSGFHGRPSLIWEFRQKLQELQTAGKQVVIHADRLAQGTYYLASVADYLTLDPQGSLSFPGLVLSRSYLKGTLEKLGLGFQEHRYFKYKSAAETLSRDSMSEADREQRQRIVDVIYEQLRQGIATGRSLDEKRFDQIVDDLGLLTAPEAVDQGLVDAVGRWDDIPEWLQQQRHARLANPNLFLPAGDPWDDVWGPAVRIPVVFAVGTCDMDSGIKGRATSAYLRQLVDDPTVAAVVLRADSPGGDPLPSDLVADAVRQLKKAGKPVIVSQGDVAASGGYWISMDGTRILTTPLTITGSIGVISGWLWNDGLAEKMGITSDVVSRGRHADLFASVNLPLLGGLPRRPMNDQELARVETLIRTMYGDFVAAVAKGRNMTPEAVGEIAQGRVWMGGDAIERGLCDGFGTLSDAIAQARAEAGVPSWRKIEIVEYPPRPLFMFPTLFPGLPSFIGLDWNPDAWLAGILGNRPTREAEPASPAELLPGLGLLETDYVRRIGREPGRPLLMLPPQDLPQQWRNMEN